MSIIAKNRRAKYDYEISDTIEAGVVLDGPEVKSIKNGNISLKGSYVNFIKGELYLINAHVSPYKFSRHDNYDPTRSRKLLIKKSQIKKLMTAKQNGFTLLALNAKNVRGYVKITIGIGKSKKRHDKRQVIKERDTRRDIERQLKRS